ncbi:VOC family protein [Saccharopolyspora flava]|uniref:Lactoylglutathione lyase n=1 Tax=Saccharopolyspora flava TaxID=95161 RepID=A0A1I6UF21_9PSEU|nr:VOC family protein [Saccharopolyspora flava]SFT00011.1 lactoylglutathione lyase [Saccharopolyspora flava]
MLDSPRYGFTKIVVNDLDAEFAFYRAVLGRVERTRYEFDTLAEILMTSPGGTDQSLGLLHFKGKPAPTPGSSVLGFQTADIEDTVRRAEEAGGTVTEPPKEIPEVGVKVAFVQDPEGHVLELVEQL